MTTILILTTLVVSSVFFSLPSAAQAGQGSAAKAQALFDKAMNADASGDCQTHDRLLDAALQADPDFELARWHLGQVFFRGYWRSLDTVQAIVEHDPRWKEYQQLLEASGDTVDDHVQLAQWCRRNNLENEEKLHWQRVLQAVPEHPQALKYLGKKPFQDGYYSQEEIAELKQKERQAQLSHKRYAKKIKLLVNEARSADGDSRSSKLAELARIDDPAAVEALFDVLVKNCGKEDSKAEESEDSFELQVCSAIIAALGNIPDHPSTLRLLDIAVFAPQSESRNLAVEALRYREPTSYMPLLLDCLSAPLEFTFSVDVLPNGRVNVTEDIFTEGLEEGNRKVRNTAMTNIRRVPVDPYAPPGSPGSMRVEVPDARANVRDANRRIAETQKLVATENLNRDVRNSRVCQVLEAITGEKLGNDPHAWWDAWVEYNELYTPEEVPILSTFTQEYYRTPQLSCFLAGTSVWTQAGPVPIEDIKVGDLVLSQDPLTGRLDYRPVSGTTLRPPSEMLTLSVNDEEITTTLGHRFWVSGEGWRMAKFLNAGSQLFAVQGSMKMASISEAEEAEAHNLVVDGYHTYFVGKGRLLVHDNSCPVPTTVVLPGVELEQNPSRN